MNTNLIDSKYGGTSINSIDGAQDKESSQKVSPKNKIDFANIT